LRKRFIMVLVVAFAVLSFWGCSAGETDLSAGEQEALLQLFPEVEPDQIVNITTEFMTAEIQEKFPAVVNVSKINDDYGFICKPIGYSGPIKIAVGINTNEQKLVGIRIIDHSETEHHVRDIENAWFVNRFVDKKVPVYLEYHVLEAVEDNQIVSVTGATISTSGIINGTNAAMGVFSEKVLNQSAEPVSLTVEGHIVSD
jgi:Na+-translocating ferredoxin:NAD+ oxidoreductase RnfG subunit